MRQCCEIFDYQVYGLTLRANQPLTGLIATSTPAPVDIEVDLVEDGTAEINPDEKPDYLFKWQTQQKADGTYYQLQFRTCGRVNFEINPTGSKIRVTWTDALLTEITAILIGSVLGCALRLRGRICLHASVIAIGESAIAIIGVKGAGKSTTAAALTKRGYPILADDVAVLADYQETFLVQPGYPRLRLWKPAVNALYGSEAGLPRVFRQIDKHFVELNQDSADGASAWRFHPNPLPLAAIYILGNRQPELATPAIESISPQLGLMYLMTHRYPKFLKLDRDGQAREFALLSRLTSTVLVKQIHRPDDLTQLPKLCEAILDDAGMLTCNKLKSSDRHVK